ncbi:hypothetical protein E3P99_00929 [Wallemia hederae]|uniref:MIT domain-containing protein n=1 Tax=Wallemia hederae TaxID=1540922 RepID=A0A4T0FSU0_9BASI|nr:hypothetical protein E3P99_00929 [Wallemia hederae]
MNQGNGPSSPNPLFELGRAYSSSQQSTPTTNNFTSAATKANRVSSRQMLNNALSLANTAVNLDKDNDFVNALAAYKDAMTLLESVMVRVDLENKSDADQHKPASRRLEEARRLKLIVGPWFASKIRLISSQHETYKDRIRLLEVLLDANQVQQTLTQSAIAEEASAEQESQELSNETETTNDTTNETSPSSLSSPQQHSQQPQQPPLSSSTASSSLSNPQQRKSDHVTTPSISIQPGSPLDPPPAAERSDSNQTLTNPPQRPPMNRSRSSSTNSSYRLPTRTSSMASLSEKQHTVPLINPSVGEGSLIQRRQQASKVNDFEAFETETTKAFKLDNTGAATAAATATVTDNQRPQSSATSTRLRAVSQPDRRPSLSSLRHPSIPPSLPIEQPRPAATTDTLSLMKTLSANLYPTSQPNIPDPPSRGKPSFECYHMDPTRRPFQLMKLLAKSIREGAYISPRLYVSPQIWLDSRNVIKLNYIEVKVKSLETILEGLFEIYTVGKRFVASQVEDEVFLNSLWEFNRVLDEVQSQLHKKLDLNSYSGHSFSPTAPTNAKSNNSVGNWTSKLSRSLGVSNGRKSEEGWLYAYIDLLNKVFVNAQVLDVHLGYLRNDVYELYKDSTTEIRSSIEKSLVYSSTVFSRSVCKFVLADLDVLIGKWTKRSHGVEN